jgi:acetyl-CoA carboxylase biotin carboxyl carrier protein
LADDPKTKPRPFDVGTIRYLLELMSQHDLSEIDLHEGDNRIRLRRGALVAAAAPPAAFAHYPAPAGPNTAPAAQAQSAAAPDKKYHEIRSEFVGTFYARPKPEAEPFVKVGSKVKPDTVVGLIEAMKLFNDVTAGITGTVAEVCVENQQGVEFNTVLFKVELSS